MTATTSSPTSTGKATTTLDRLEAWGCRLYRTNEPRTPIGLPGGPWEMSGLAEWLQDVLGAHEDQMMDRDEVVDEINKQHPDYFLLDRETIEASGKLDWRGYNLGASGWACNIKLHDTFQYRCYWDPILDHLDVEDVPLDFNHVTDYEWEHFEDEMERNEILDHTKFVRGGRSGGWLLYTKQDLSLAEADALKVLYEKTIPPWLDYVCRMVATEEVGWLLADYWDTEYFAEESTIYFEELGFTLTVDYSTERNDI